MVLINTGKIFPATSLSQVNGAINYRRCLLVILIFWGSLFSIFAQQSTYTISEKDSTVYITEPISIGKKSSLSIEIEEELNNYPYYLKFEWKNETDSTIYTMFGSEGVIVPITKYRLIAPGETIKVTYQFHNVREPGTRFSQCGHITSYKTDPEGKHLLTSMYQSFLISGTWAAKSR